VAIEWVETDRGRRCVAHGTEFSRIHSCPQCAIVEGATVDDDETTTIVIPTGCLSVQQLESRFLAIADVAEWTARQAIADGEWSGKNLAAKMLDVAIKALRQASVVATSREQEHTVNRQMKQLERLTKRGRPRR
jgi:UDP-N-acetylglucosamine enolpyruvyl transferase